MHKFSLFRSFIFFICIIFFTSSCTNAKEEKIASETISTAQTEKTDEPAIQWYYFVPSDKFQILPVNSITEVPKTEFKPWTEAETVVNFGLYYENPLILINKAGILSTKDFPDAEKLVTIPEFKDKTIAGFYKTNLGTMIRFYTNTVFSDIYDFDTGFCLYRYNSIEKKITPVISAEHFNLKKIAQLTNLSFNKKWYASFKTEINNQIEFNYFEFASFSDILEKNYRTISQQEFIDRTNVKFLHKKTEKNSPFPEITKKLLECEYDNLNIKIFAEELKDKLVFFKSDMDSTYKENCKITANTLEFSNSKDKIKAILFNNGKLLYSKNNQNWKVKELPALPENFVYTSFVIEKNKILAAWEEQNFFQIGKSGLLKINLN